MTIEKAIREYIEVPQYINCCANAIRYDLLHGPLWSLIPDGDIEKYNDDCLATFYGDLASDAGESDIIEQTYIGIVADTLRCFIDNLPGTLYYNKQTDFITDKEPDSTEECFDCYGTGLNSFDIDCEYCEGTGRILVHLSDWQVVDCKKVIEYLFGKTIAREFY